MITSNLHSQCSFCNDILNNIFKMDNVIEWNQFERKKNIIHFLSWPRTLRISLFVHSFVRNYIFCKRTNEQTVVAMSIRFHRYIKYGTDIQKKKYMKWSHPYFICIQTNWIRMVWFWWWKIFYKNAFNHFAIVIDIWQMIFKWKITPNKFAHTKAKMFIFEQVERRNNHAVHNSMKIPQLYTYLIVIDLFII